VVSRSVAALGRMPNRLLGYIENMSGYYCARCEDIRPLFPSTAAVALGAPCLGRVPFDAELAAHCDRGSPLDSARPTAAALRQIAERVDHALGQQARPAAGGGEDATRHRKETR